MDNTHPGNPVPAQIGPLYGLVGPVPGPVAPHFNQSATPAPNWGSVLGEQPDTGAADADDAKGV